MASATQNNMTIKEKLKKNIFNLSNVPCIFVIDYDKVLVNKDAPYPNELQSLEKLVDLETALVEAKKLIAQNRDAQLKIGKISVHHFESRNEFDAIYLRTINKEEYSKQIEKISINKALALLDVDVSCNMEYYLNNQKELENDLNRKVNESEFNVPKLEQELFYNLMCKWFGSESESFDHISQMENKSDKSYQKECTLNDFRVHFSTNYYYATAQRENYYFIFEYVF
ncbi:hypothetical protein BpHYR1_030076 [Brachionus plicatilis]|uniref:Uncharacterized protein n=1 Tax=Brachionus plicatilis TaxID=10195 RepID=A0A3M7RDH0_BRAPC|nr:hypothetical protein BpHYR1_030076 [Brachionus plicatilis]